MDRPYKCKKRDTLPVGDSIRPLRSPRSSLQPVASTSRVDTESQYAPSAWLLSVQVEVYSSLATLIQAINHHADPEPQTAVARYQIQSRFI